MESSSPTAAEASAEPSSSRRVQVLWLSFLVLWALTQLYYGAVAPWAVAATAIGLAILNLAALVLLPEPPRLSRGAALFLGAFGLLFAVQFLPAIPGLFPFVSRLRETHGVGGAWPATADAFLTLRSFVQFAAYVLAALLVLRLRQEGLSTAKLARGVVALLVLQAAYGVVQQAGKLETIPFFGPRPYAISASGTLVNRNSFAGLLAMGLALAAALGFRGAQWPRRQQGDSHKAGWEKRLRSALPWAAAAALFAVAIILSHSRGGSLSALAALVLLPLLFRGGAGALVAAGLALVVALSAIVADPSVLVERFEQIDPLRVEENPRWKYWTTTSEAGLRQPVLGFGIGTHPEAYHPFQPPTISGQVQHAHNEYVNFFFEGGAAMLVLVLAGFVAWLIAALKRVKRHPGPDRLMGMAAIVAVCAIALHSLVDFDLRITSVGLLFATLMAAPAGSAGGTSPPRRGFWLGAAAAGLAGAVLLLALPLDPDDRVEKALGRSAAEAEALTRTTLGLSPCSYRAAWTYAKAADLAGDKALAEKRLETAAELWPAHPDLQMDAGLRFWETYRETKDARRRDRAATCLRRLFEQQPTRVAEVMEEIWKEDVPLAEYQELLPGTPAAAGVYAGFLASKGLWDESLAFFEKNCPRTAENARVFDHFAAKLGEASQWGLEAVIRDLRLQVKSDPPAYAASARAWAKLEAWDRALERIETACRIDLANAEWLALMGDIRRARGDTVNALEAYIGALRVNPMEVKYLVKRGTLYADMKLWPHAITDFREAQRSHPDLKDAALGLVQALAGSGDLAGARRALEDYALKAPADPDVAALRAALNP